MAETPASHWNESSSQGSQPPAPTQSGNIPNLPPPSPQASGKRSGQCSRPPKSIPVGGSKKKNKKKKSKAKKRLRSPEPSSSNVTNPPLPQPSSPQASESGSVPWAERSKRQKVVAKKDLHTDKFFRGIAATIHKSFPVYAFAEEYGCNPAEVLDVLSAVVEAPLCMPQPWHFADSVSKYGKRLIASWHDTHWPAAHVPQDRLDFYERCEREEKVRLSKADFEAQQRYKERQIRAIGSIIREGTPKPIEQSVSTEAYTPPAPAFSDSDGISISSKDPAWKGKEPVRREIQSSPEAGPSVPRFRSPRQVEPLSALSLTRPPQPFARTRMAFTIPTRIQPGKEKSLSDEQVNCSVRQFLQYRNYYQVTKSKFVTKFLGPVSWTVNGPKTLTCVQFQTKWVTLNCNRPWLRGHYSKKGDGWIG